MKSIGRSKKGGTTKIHAACVSEKFALKIQLSAGNRHDAPEGPRLIESFSCKVGWYLFMDCGYEDNKTLSPCTHTRAYFYCSSEEK